MTAHRGGPDEPIDLDKSRFVYDEDRDYIPDVPALFDEIDRLRTELAEARASHDEWAQVGSTLVDIGVNEQARADALQARIDAVLALHRKIDNAEGTSWCSACSIRRTVSWPCPTVRALTGEAS